MLPYSSEQVASWKARDLSGVEPVRLELLDWTVTSSSALPNQRDWQFQRGEASILLTRDWDYPLTPGQPMAVDSVRKIDFPGHPGYDVHRTSMFQGMHQVVDVVYLRGTDWYVRLVFARCEEAQVVHALEHLVIAV